MIMIDQYHLTFSIRQNQPNERKLVRAVRTKRFRTALSKAVREVMRRQGLTDIRTTITS